MFIITRHKGFHIRFENRWTISVQFGAGNYCDNYDMMFGQGKNTDRLQSTTAEIGIFNPKDELIQHPDFEGNTVKGWVTPDELVKYIIWTSTQDKEV